MYSMVWGAGGRRGARAGGTHPWIWGAPRSRGLHDLEVAVVLLVIGAAQHHRQAHGPPKEDHLHLHSRVQARHTSALRIVD